MIPLVAPTITQEDRDSLGVCAFKGLAFDERLVREFESVFAERVACAGAVAVCSGTTALKLALRATGHVDDVAVPTYSCSAILNALDRATRPVFVDSTFDVRSAIMVQGVASVLIHAFGTETQGDIGTPVEDYTLSLGAVPSLLGTIGVCSSHASKMISTGRGGIVFSNDKALLQAVREQAYYDDTANGRLGAQSLGMTSMQAALGLSQLAQLDSFIDRRREIAAVYSARFDAAGIECPDADCGSVFFRYLIAVDDPAAKVAALAEHGIEAGRGVYPPLHRQLGMPDDQFPGATWCVDHLLSVPCHPSLRDADMRYIAETVIEVCA